jgi:hypothetical protein
MALDADTIAKLLKAEITSQSKKTPTGQPSVQMGPLRWVEGNRPCGFTTGIGCGAPTRIRIDGDPMCTTHALNYLNKLILEHDEVRLEDCTCESGKYSQGNIHNPACDLVKIKSETLEEL